MKKPLTHTLLLLAATWLSTAALAQLSVQDAWVRATVPQQKATGAFMQLQAQEDGKLLGARSPVAGVVEVHEMAMEGNIMKMRAVSALPLPAGKPVALKPGGYHVMLMDLKGPIRDGDSVPLSLLFQGKNGQTHTVEVKAIARGMGAPAANPPDHGSHHKH